MANFNLDAMIIVRVRVAMIHALQLARRVADIHVTIVADGLTDGIDFLRATFTATSILARRERL